MSNNGFYSKLYFPVKSLEIMLKIILTVNFKRCLISSSLFEASEVGVFPTSLTNDVTSEIVEDDWERGCINSLRENQKRNKCKCKGYLIRYENKLKCYTRIKQKNYFGNK